MLDLYLLNETFTNGSNHALLTFVSIASAINGIFVIVSKNTFVCVLYLLLLLLLLLLFLFIILLSVQVKDFNHDQTQEVKHVEDQKHKERKKKFEVMDIVHGTFRYQGRIRPNKQFVWDKNDPSGTKLRDLFFPARIHVMNGITGISVTHSANSWDAQNSVIMPRCSSEKVITMFNSGVAISTNGAPITFSPIPGSPDLTRLNVQQSGP